MAMVRTFLRALILVPIAVLLILFAVANRQWIALSLDPFFSDPPALAVHLPLFLAILLAVMLGVIVGGVATWFSQRKWRAAPGPRPGSGAPNRRLRQTRSLRSPTGRLRPPEPTRGHAHNRRRRYRPRADLSGAGRGARSGVPHRGRGAGAPPSPHRPGGRLRRAAGHAGVDRGIPRLQAGERVSRQRRARKTVGVRHLSVDVRPQRRAAGGDRRPRAHRVADRRGLRARRQISRPAGCHASGDGRRRRARPAPRARARKRATGPPR